VAVNLLARCALGLAILSLPLLTGCMGGRNFTIVEGRLKPSHFQFTTIVEQHEARPGGWRAACLHLRLSRDTGASTVCTVGVEVPLQTEMKGPISLTRAQRVAANCANLAAELAFGPTTPETPLGLACTSFIHTYNATLQRALAGTRVNTYCREGTTPFPAP
jgi:hypothetical protein